MSDNKNDLDDLDDDESTRSEKLNRSGSQSSSGGTEDIAGPDSEDIRSRTSRGENVTNKADTDNEGRVTQRSNTDI